MLGAIIDTESQERFEKIAVCSGGLSAKSAFSAPLHSLYKVSAGAVFVQKRGVKMSRGNGVGS
jgi:hypothetical protein